MRYKVMYSKYPSRDGCKLCHPLNFFFFFKFKDQCKPWDPIGIANECTVINPYRTNVENRVSS